MQKKAEVRILALRRFAGGQRRRQGLAKIRRKMLL
jgi:hypothetical protein